MQMHAHKCEVCEKKGRSVVWIHGEDQRGIEAAHKCPECGSTQWAKWLIEVPRMPKSQHQNAQQRQASLAVDWMQVYFMVLTILAMIFIVRYGAELLAWWKEHGKETIGKGLKK